MAVSLVREVNIALANGGPDRAVDVVHLRRRPDDQRHRCRDAPHRRAETHQPLAYAAR